MATSLGSLVVSLGLNAAEFTTGLTKSEREAAQFAKKLDQAIATGAKAAAGAIVALGTAAAGAFLAINELAKQAGNFKDLEEVTGANAESIASFAVAAGTAGVAVETIAGAMNKLTKGLVTTEDETKDAGAALAALGIPIKEFKALDPATQVEEVAKALAGFEDGASKTAVAMALFGKSGAALLPFLKELAAEGGRQVILTQQQIERADAYSDAQARARTQVQLYLQALATEALPTITSVITATKSFIAALVGVSTSTKDLDGEQIRKFAETGLIWFTRLIDAGDGVGRIFRILGNAAGAGLAAAEAALSGDFSGAKSILEDFKRQREKILQETLASRALQAQFDADRKQRELAAREDRGFKPRGKQLSFSGKEDSSKAAAQKVSDAERLIESLEKQLEKTQDLTVLEQVELEISKAKFSGLTQERLAAIEVLAVRIQDAEIAKKAAEDQKRAEDEASRIREQNSKALTKKVEDELKEAQGMRDVNDRYDEQIIFLREGEEGIRRLNAAKLDKLILDKKDELMAAASIENNERLVAAINEQIAALERRKGLAGDIVLAEQLKKEADQLQNLKDSFSDALTGPLYDFITGTKKAGDAFKQFLNNINSLLAQKAANSISDYIFGGKTGNAGGFDWGTIAKLIIGVVGGGSTSGLPTSSTGGGFGEHFATGTAFAPGGRAWVGESGPELVDLPRGARVMSSEKSKQMMGQPMIFNVNVLPGASTATGRQAALATADQVRRVVGRR